MSWMKPINLSSGAGESMVHAVQNSSQRDFIA